MATNPKVEKLVHGFFQAKIMFLVNESVLIYEKQLDKLGLLDDLETLLVLEEAFIDYKNFKHNSELALQRVGK